MVQWGTSFLVQNSMTQLCSWYIAQLSTGLFHSNRCQQDSLWVCVYQWDNTFQQDKLPVVYWWNLGHRNSLADIVLFHLSILRTDSNIQLCMEYTDLSYANLESKGTIFIVLVTIWARLFESQFVLLCRDRYHN